MSIKSNVKCVLVCCLFPMATAVWAGDDSMKDIDANGDGVISKKEAADNKKLVINWSTIDRNKDDKIDSAEFSAFEIEEMSGHDNASE